jgi:hypothetical protein
MRGSGRRLKDHSRDPDADAWELYYLPDDFSQAHDPDRFSFAGDVQNVQRGMIPRIYGRSYAIEAQLQIPAGGAEGVIVANPFTGTIKKVIFDLHPATHEDENALHEHPAIRAIGHGAAG